MKPSFEDLNEMDSAVVPNNVLHLIKNADAKHVDGHNRLRLDVDSQEERLQSVERTVGSHSEQLKNALRRTTDVSALRFTPSMVGAIVVICGSIIGGFYGATWGIRDDVRDIKQAQTDMAELKKVETKLEDERNVRMLKDIGDIKAQQQMQDLKINNLRETVLTNQRR